MVLFGASNYGKIAYDYLKDKYCILYYCDNDKNKWGQQFNGCEIISPEQLKNITATVIITSSYYEDISHQLFEMGIKDFRIFQLDLKDYYDYVKEEKERHENSFLLDLRTENFHSQIVSNYNLHLMVDNIYCKKFIEFVNGNFPNSNNLYIILKHRNRDLRHFNSHIYNNVELMNVEEMGGKLYLYIKNANKVFIHFLKDYICKFIYDYDIKEKLYWIVWGADLYSYIQEELYDELTKKLLKKINYPIPNQLFQSSSSLFYRRKAIKNISYILSGFTYEYEKTKEFFSTNAQFLLFIYPNPINFVSLTKCNNKNQVYKKKNNKYAILIGNSADPTNNHLDMFRTLKNLDYQNIDIIVPLSYGGNQEYIDYVIKKGEEFFGNHFIPIKDYMKPEDYFSILKQIDIAIMNHNRQQAAGNIFALLYLGKPVFLKSKTSLFKGLTDLGFELFKIEELEKNQLTGFIKNNNVIDNRIDMYFGEAKARENWSQILQIK